MRAAFCIVPSVLLVLLAAKSIDLANDKSRLEARVSELSASRNIEIDELTAKLKTQTDRAAALATSNVEHKAELRKLAAALENANDKIETSLVKMREQAAELEKNRKLIFDVEKKLKSAESALATAQKAVEKEKAAEEPEQFELNQDVYTKRFLAISSRLNKEIDIAKKKNPPERPKKSQGAFASGWATTSSDAAPAHIRAAEKILRELESENKPSQKFYAAVSAEKQRWANDKTKREYLSKCAIQLRRDLEQFSSNEKTYLDE